MSKQIHIPKLKLLNVDYERYGKQMYQVCDVLDFYIENAKLLQPLNNTNTETQSMRCLKNYNNEYKIFAYKTLGVLTHTEYFLLSVSDNKVYILLSGDLDSLKEWCEYLSNGGSYEKATKHNETFKLDFDISEGI